MEYAVKGNKAFKKPCPPKEPVDEKDHPAGRRCAAVTSASGAGAQDLLLNKGVDEWAAKVQPGNDAKTRRTAAFALGKIGPRAGTARAADLLACLKDGDPTVRREAAAFAAGRNPQERRPARRGQRAVQCPGLDSNDLVTCATRRWPWG